MPKTPKYFHSGLGLMAFNMKGVEWCPFLPPNLPIDHSIHKRGMPIRRKHTRYGIIKVPPPFCTACTGNLKKFPKPTEFPAIARINPTLDPQASFFISIAGLRRFFYKM
jgi:hypothetical protein